MTGFRIGRAARLALVPIAALAAAAAAYGATYAHSSAASAAPSGTLVIDRSFEIKTADPQRAFEPTASIVDRAIYDTLLTYRGSDVAHPVPMLARSFTASKDAKTYTFNLRDDVHFADGTPLTSADVVFSFRRLINLKGNPSFLLAGVTVRARGKYGVEVKSATPNAALPAILANTSLGVVNSKLVKQHGGTDAANAAKTDKAEKWLNSPASAGAGSGPYVLKSYSVTSQITLAPNTRYWGARKPVWNSIVIRNMISATQLINIQRGRNEVAIDLSSQQAQSLRNNSRLKVTLTPSTWVFWLFANNDSAISSITPNKRFQNAVRYGLDYRSIVGIAGPGAIQAPGVIPSMFLGSLPQRNRINRDLAKAKAELSASGVGSQKLTLEFPSDLTVNGVPFTTLAQKVQANLEEVGFDIELSGAPVGTWLQKYRDGKMAFGLSLWGPDYPDPADYLVFLPGELVGTRTGWKKGGDPTVEALGNRARTATDDKARTALYRQIQRRLNVVGPVFPLIQPTQVFVATNDLRNAVFNAVYQIDVTRTLPK